MADFTNLAKLIALIGERRAIELFDDDGDLSIDEADAAVAFAMGSANKFVKSVIFRKGFTGEQIDALTADESLQRYATAIFAQYAGQRKAEFTDANGHAPFHTLGEQARKDLASIATGELRSILEETTVGQNPIVSADVDAPCPTFIIARSPGDPVGPGGF
jgi:hypothetical protein